MDHEDISPSSLLAFREAVDQSRGAGRVEAESSVDDDVMLARDVDSLVRVVEIFIEDRVDAGAVEGPEFA